MRVNRCLAVFTMAAFACTGVRRRAYAQEGFNTATTGCAANPLNCTALTGVVPESGSIAQAIGATGALATVVLIEALDQAAQAKVDQVVKECTDMARADVLLRLFNGKSPTAEECEEDVALSPQKTVKRYFLFGKEMHKAALQCVSERLGKLIPGRFSIEPRYRIDERTRQTTWMSPEEENQILRDQRWVDLEGTLKPDLVIHNGNPRYIQGIYDFKFPCKNTDEQPQWRKGRASDGSEDQDVMYREKLGKKPAMVVPILGIFR